MLPDQGEAPETGVRPRRQPATPGAAFHADTDCADGANGGVQPAPYAGTAAMPLAAVEPGPFARKRVGHDAEADLQHARRAPRRHDGVYGQAAAGRIDP